MSATEQYPVRVEGRLEREPSRWLWLVKWLLAIPHYVVLLFLWIAFFLLGVVAFFAILFTGRYPRSIFDFNVGVLRWTWRVGFYTYGALGTDRYPPFSLSDEPGYPASLEVEYPERLSRGLVLVKWWLLAIPQYIVVGVFAGGGSWLAWKGEHWGWTWGGGLIGLLVLIAGVALLFTGRYPRGIFDLVLGLDRWAIRVAGYAALMTDVYPPFRLDQGGSEPGSHTDEPATATVAAPPATGGGWGVGRIVLLAVGAVTGLVALGLLAGGVGALVVDRTQREDGFVTSPYHAYSTPTYALVSETTELEGPRWAWRDLVGTVRVTGKADHAVFLGIGRESDVQRYLAGVGHDVVRDITEDPGGYDRQSGGPPPGPPGEQSFWVASGQGTGDVQVDWDVARGHWALVVMNPDGGRYVDASLRIGAELDGLPWLGGALLGAGLLVALVAVVLVVVALPKGRQAASGPPSPKVEAS
jgi:Domain of unknown function (DUF4389)